MLRVQFKRPWAERPSLGRNGGDVDGKSGMEARKCQGVRVRGYSCVMSRMAGS